MTKSTGQAASKNDDDFRDIQRKFALHLRDPSSHPAPEGIEDRRIAIYRRLVFGNIRSLLKSRFPVIRDLLTDDQWNGMMRDFLIKHRAVTPLFPELGDEFIRYIQEQRADQQHDLPFLLELAHYERAGSMLVNSTINLDEIDINPDGDVLTGIPVFSPLAWVLGYSWPVHQIRPEFQPDTPPENPTWLLIYRNRNNKRLFMELKPATARLCELLQANEDQTGQQILQAFAQELGQPESENVINAGAKQLVLLQQKGILLGTTS